MGPRSPSEAGGQPPPTLGELLQRARRTLAEAGSDSAALDAELLAGRVLSAPRAVILAHPELPLGAESVARFEQLVARRAAHEPMAYLLGEREFYGRAFAVDRRVLIPRPESELLVEAALVRLRKVPRVARVVDVGAGSGCLAVTLALESDARVVAVDASAEALALARQNAARLAVPSAQLDFVRGSLLSWLRQDRPPDVIVANLPYVPTEALGELPADVRLYEPREALDGGPGGTRLLFALIDQCAALRPRFVLAELDPRHAETVLDYAEARLGSSTARLLPDLAGLWRILAAELPERAR